MQVEARRAQRAAPGLVMARSWQAAASAAEKRWWRKNGAKKASATRRLGREAKIGKATRRTGTAVEVETRVAKRQKGGKSARGAGAGAGAGTGARPLF